MTALPDLTVREAASTLSEVRERLRSEVLEALVRGSREVSCDSRARMHLQDATGDLLDILDQLLQVYVTFAEIAWAAPSELTAEGR